MLNIFCIFSICASSLFICASILFPIFWITFTIINLNSFQVDGLFPLHLFGLLGFYHIPSAAVYFPVFSFCLIYCVLALLSSSLWCLPSMGRFGTVPSENFPLEGSHACVLVERAGSYLSEDQCHIQCFGGIYGLVMALGSLSANGQGCVPVLLKVWCEPSSNGACWPLCKA